MIRKELSLWPMQYITDMTYALATVFFILGLKMLGKEKTARIGNLVSGAGMLLAVVVTFFGSDILYFGYAVLAIGTGIAVAIPLAYRIKVIQIPEMVALLNGLGGLASLLVGIVEHFKICAAAPGVENNSIMLCATKLAVFSAAFIGGITFSGSAIAYFKLAEKLKKSVRVRKSLNYVLLAISSVFGLIIVLSQNFESILVVAIISLILGVTYTVPIGGGDMPVIISLLNSLSGMAAAATGFISLNSILIVAGCLVGTSGLILTAIMCKAMNRKLSAVLFGGFGAVDRIEEGILSEPISASAGDMYYVLECARRVFFVPGYGMAVSQAHHVLKELGFLLEANGTEVKYAIHPVAGRMPGHMNVLLAEAGVPYEQLIDMDTANDDMKNVDVAVVIGANDVVNTAAVNDKDSPIYGMPIINVHLAKSVFVLKRGQGRGFSGLQNQLFAMPNARMVYGDAKRTLSDLIAEFKG